MDKNTFRKTEKKLYNYFGKDKKINSINKKITLLNKQIENIENKLKNVDINIPEESKSITYEERVQTSSDGASYAEITLMRITDKLLIEQARKKEEIAELEEELRSIEADSIIIETNINEINNEDMEFLKMKYKDKLKDWQIAMKIGKDQSTATRIRQGLVEDIARWEEWYKRY